MGLLNAVYMKFRAFIRLYWKQPLTYNLREALGGYTDRGTAVLTPLCGVAA